MAERKRDMGAEGEKRPVADARTKRRRRIADEARSRPPREFAGFNILDYEGRTQPLLSRVVFARRVAASCGIAVLLIALSLLAGMSGYHYFEGLPWVDAFTNAAMILSGMGPMAELHTTSGKLFAGLYALYSGLALILATGLIFAPLVHRMLHRFHVDVDDDEERAKPAE